MDLNIVVEEDKIRDSDTVIIDKVKRSISLGYKVIALAVHVDGRNLAKTTVVAPPKIHKTHKFDKKVSIYTRLTVTMDDQAILYKLSQSQWAKEYDILAIQPLNEKIMQSFCSGNIDCDILTLNMSEKLPFDLKRVNLTLPVVRGSVFEINYSQALSSQTARVNVISNGQLLVDKSRSKSILLSSGARNLLFLRSPYDVCNLALLFDLKDHLARESVFKLADKVIQYACARKNAASLAVKVEQEETIESALIKSNLQKISKRKQPPPLDVGKVKASKVK